MANIPELPPTGAHLWAYFLDLCATRASGSFGPAPLSRHDIRQWQEDEGIELERWERRLILNIDTAWRLSTDTSKADGAPQEEA